VFAAVAAEAGRLLGADFTGMSRYDADDTATAVGMWTSTDTPWPMAIGDRLSLGGRNVTTLVSQTGRPARIDDYSGSGLVGLKDRVEALGGRIRLHSQPGTGTTLEVQVPMGMSRLPGDN
jgi:hypothetical protein